MLAMSTAGRHREFNFRRRDLGRSSAVDCVQGLPDGAQSLHAEQRAQVTHDAQ